MCIYKVTSLTLISDEGETPNYREFEVGYYATNKLALEMVKSLICDEAPKCEADFFYSDYWSEGKEWKKYRIEPIAVLEEIP